MLHVNDDSNDELFRKAAEDYFLGANNPDFSTFNSRIDDGVAAPATETNCNKEKPKRYYQIPVAGWFYNKPVLKTVSMLRSLLYGKSKKKVSAGFYIVACALRIRTGFYFSNNF